MTTLKEYCTHLQRGLNIISRNLYDVIELQNQMGTDTAPRTPTVANVQFRDRREERRLVRQTQDRHNAVLRWVTEQGLRNVKFSNIIIPETVNRIEDETIKLSRNIRMRLDDIRNNVMA